MARISYSYRSLGRHTPKRQAGCKVLRFFLDKPTRTDRRVGES
jgi:hypothetical protein